MIELKWSKLGSIKQISIQVRPKYNSLLINAFLRFTIFIVQVLLESLDFQDIRRVSKFCAVEIKIDVLKIHEIKFYVEFDIDNINKNWGDRIGVEKKVILIGVTLEPMLTYSAH